MDKKEKWELIWVLVVILLFAIVIVSTIPLDFEVGGVPSVLSQLNGVPASKIINVELKSEQYLFIVNETGNGIRSDELGNSYYYNLIVAHPGEYLNITMTSLDVTSNFYFADYADKVVTDQIVPGLVTYDVLPVPNITGAYTFLNGEYNGPWFSYQTGLLLDIPYHGYFTQSNITEYKAQTDIAQSSALKGDPYNPPIIGPAESFILVANTYGIFNNSLPGPTLIVNSGNNITVKMYIPTPNNDGNYLYNYTKSGIAYPDNGSSGVQIGIYAVWWNGTIKPVEVRPIQYGTYMTFTFNAIAPAYLYGIIMPVYYNYNPSGLSATDGSLLGIQKGYVMGAWGVILVEG